MGGPPAIGCWRATAPGATAARWTVSAASVCRGRRPAVWWGPAPLRSDTLYLVRRVHRPGTVNSGMVTIEPIRPISVATHAAAVDLATRHGFSFCDALIVASALLKQDATPCWTEALQAGRKIQGLTIVSPLASPAIVDDTAASSGSTSNGSRARSGTRRRRTGRRGDCATRRSCGSAQSLVKAGGSTAELMQAGRWRDPRTATAYTEAELAGRGPVARLFYGRG